jgi:histidyl-tRNA synthetase
VLRLIDRRDKMPPEEWRAAALAGVLSAQQLDALCDVLANDQLWRQSPEMERFFAAIDAFGLGEWVRFAPHVIRGLLYYTGTVFEAWDMAGEFRALFGGGRYDNLVADVGGESLPAVGFAMGDMVTGLLLRKLGRFPTGLGASPAQVLVTVFDATLLADSLALATELRDAGLRVATYPELARLGKQLKYADKMAIPIAVVLGPDEKGADLVNVKDLGRAEQSAVRRTDAASTIIAMLERQKRPSG